MTKLLSGRVKKVKSANVRASRYDFIGLSETEPDLGVPVANGYILAANTDGTRYWATVAAGLSLDTFSTSNLKEGSNLYYTNARVISGVSTGLISNLSVSGNIIVGNVISAGGVGGSIVGANLVQSTYIETTQVTVTGNIIAGNVISAGGVGGSIVGANLIQTNYLQANTGTFTGNIIAGNIISAGGVGGSIVGANLVQTVYIQANIWQGLYTPNVIEDAASNVIYYTNSRVYSNVIQLLNSLGLGGGLGQITLTTDKVNETSNLYYTNTRVIAAVSNATISNLTIAGNIFAGNALFNGDIGAITVGANLLNSVYLTTTQATVTGNIIAGNVISAGGVGGSIVGANLIQTNYLQANTGTFTGNIIAGNIISAGGVGGSIVGANLVQTNYLQTNILIVQGVDVTQTLLTSNVVSQTSISNVLIANTIIANIWQGIYTANVLETSSNLYFTNTRVYDNVIRILNSLNLNGQLTTANVNELGNLYYTNSRVISAVVGTTLSNLTVSGNIVVGNVISASGVGGSILGANLVQTNYIQANVWQGIYTANVAESASNLYYTNARVYANVQPLLTLKANVVDLTTANVIESASNLYYTNSRVYANVIPLLTLKANVIDLTTANVVESASNLYYTNARVYANVQPLLNLKANVSDLTTSNVFESASNLYYTNARVLAAVANATISNLTIFGNVNVGGNVVANTIVATVWRGLYTGNIIESGNTDSGNVFFSNARARNAISAGDGTIIYDPIAGTIKASTTGTATINATIDGLTTGNVAEKASSGNLYYTNARVYSNVIELLSSLGISTGGGSLNTDQIKESTVPTSSNLYYSNARARTAITGGTGVSYSNTTGIISIGQNVSTTANVQFNNLRVDGNATFYGNASFYGNVTTYASNNLSISDNMIYLNSGSSTSNPDLGFAGNYNDGSYKHAGFFRDATDSTWKVFDSYTPEPDASQFIDTAHASFKLANLSANIITASGYFVGNGALLTNLVLPAGTLNSVTGNLNVSGNIIANGLIIQGTDVTQTLLTGNVVSQSSSSNVLTANSVTVTGNVTVGGNVNSNVVRSNTLIIAGNASVTGNVIANTFYGDGSKLTGIITTVNNVNGNLTVTGNVIANATVIANAFITTGNVTAGNVIANTFVIGGGVGGSLTGANLLQATYISGNIWQGIYTANVLESAANLYFTNARVYANVIPLLNLKANIVDLTTANVSESASNLYYTNARVYANVFPLLSTKANVVDLTTANVFESASNLYYTNARVIAAVANATISNISISGNANISGNVNGTYFVGNGYLLTGLVVNNVNGNLTVTGNVIANATVIANAFITTGNITASNINAGRIFSNTWAGLYTANVIESSSNLFYTNTRVYSNIIQLLPTLAGQNITIEANGQIRANITSSLQGNLTVVGNIIANGLVIQGQDVTQTLLTGNLIAQSSTSNVLFANSITVLGNAVINGNIISNNYIYANGIIINGTDITATARFGNLFANSATVSGNLIVGGNVISNNYLIANGLIINGSEFITGASQNLTLTARNITANVVTANAIVSNIWTGLYTTNVIETGNVLYFTNTRAVSAFSAGAGINLYANGLIEGGVLSLSDSQYFTSASFIYNGGITNVSMSASVTDSRRIIVSVDGLVQIPTVDYYVLGTALSFTSNISLNSVIEVKYFGNEAISALSFNPFLFASL